MLIAELIDCLGRYPWRDNPVHAAVVEDLTERLCANNARSRLKAAVLDPVQALRQLPPQATPAQIAEACARAGATELTGEQVAEVLAASGVIRSAAQAADVIEQLHRRLLSADNSEDAYRWEGELAKQFADGAFGEQTAAEFTRRIVYRSRTEIERHLHLLNIALESKVIAAVTR